MSKEHQLEQRVIQLEELLMHQEHVVQQLNSVVFQMRGEIGRLEAKLEEQVSRIQWKLDSNSEVRDPLDEKPPHY
ncbi:MAG: SlyX family protein [Planctomycetales bacterium]|nr:SlyX family protein [Planctomycetales bacterium]